MSTPVASRSYRALYCGSRPASGGASRDKKGPPSFGSRVRDRPLTVGLAARGSVLEKRYLEPRAGSTAGHLRVLPPEEAISARPSRLPRLLAVLAIGAVAPVPAWGQTTGTVLGRIVHEDLGTPLPGVSVSVVGLPLRAISGEEGRFVLAGVPVGERGIRLFMVGFGEVTLEGVRVKAGAQTDLGPVRLTAAPVALEPLVVRAERLRMMEPDVVVTHDVVLGRELRELPITTVEEAVELAAGVSEGHFRGGRVGQEVYVVDGIELKNQLEASTQGFGIEFSPTALEEVDVVTGGFGAEFGSALSGVVRYATRRGNPERWEGRTAVLTDQVAPRSLFTGFTGLSLSAGGPISPLGAGATVFADLLAQGMLDSDPRARGATCLSPSAVEGPVGDQLTDLAEDPRTSHLVCPYRSDLLPHQRGEKLIGFLRIDQPLPGGINLTASVLRNRLQSLLYTPEFKYNPAYQLGQRTTGTLGILSADWVRGRGGHALHVTGRGVLMRLERHLGALSLAELDERADLGGFGLSAWTFLGEDYTRLPIDRQLAEGAAVPGYIRPGGSTGSPFGPGAEGIFSTEGTPDLANWSRSDMLGADLVAEVVTSRGSSVRLGAFAKSYEVQNYERLLSHLPGSTPNYARFYPASVSGFLEARLAAADEVIVQLGVRLDAFRPGLRVVEDRSDFLSPAIDTEWQSHFGPRIGLSAPVPGTDGRTAFRFSYGLVSQPPDFRYFLDTSLGDSLRADIRRQGNPNLAFERGSAYELGVEHLLADSVAVRMTGFRKELGNLVTGSVRFQESSAAEFTTGDFGSVTGLELALRARGGLVSIRGGYALQKAVGVVTGALDDTLVDASRGRTLLPLAFDRRHSVDVAILFGAAAGEGLSPWSAALTAQVKSGYPLDREVAAGEILPTSGATVYLPWTSSSNLRLSRAFEGVPGCRSCTWRMVAEGRNVLGRENVIALRRDTGTLAPPGEVLLDQLDRSPSGPIPYESPRYSRLADIDGDGLITAIEYRQARLAAALDRFDPSLFFGEPRQLRLGLEVAF